MSRFKVQFLRSEFLLLSEEKVASDSGTLSDDGKGVYSLYFFA
jgi:hypothetical protein